jgi:hypothetical protein
MVVLPLNSGRYRSLMELVVSDYIPSCDEGQENKFGII